MMRTGGGTGDDSGLSGQPESNIHTWIPQRGHKVYNGDTGSDPDVLDLRGLGAYRVDNLRSVAGSQGYDGTVVFLTSEGAAFDTMDFRNVEAIMDDAGIGFVALDETVDSAADDHITGEDAAAPTPERVDGADNDTLDLTASNVNYISYTNDDRTDGTVTFRDGSSLTFAEVEDVVPCFTPGSTIATPRGERLVEELNAGDRIITRDNGIQEIRWVGEKKISGAKLIGSPHLRPVLIKAGALGNGLPERDMLVSPNHRMLVSNDKTQLYFEENEVLAAAKHLVGCPGIHTLDVLKVRYIHFMFDRHEVVLSNGAWTESFQPGDLSLRGVGNAQRTEILELFPELQTVSGMQDYHAARKTLKKHEANLLIQ